MMDLNTTILYCRETFEHPTLGNNKSICDEFGECWKFNILFLYEYDFCAFIPGLELNFSAQSSNCPF